MSDLRLNTLRYIATSELRKDFENKDTYFFGIFSGNSFSQECQLLTDLNMIPRTLFACDSWEGLPPEQEGVDLHPDWNTGNFNSKEYFGVNNIDVIKQGVLNKVANKTLPIQFVDGFFSESLTDELAKKCKPASYINIDVDLYISTKQVLAWLNKHNLIIINTVIYYDDWSGTETGGECLAHKEFVEETGMEFELIINDGITRSYRRTK